MKEKTNLQMRRWPTNQNGGAGYRSPCLVHAKHALYHLSYTPLLHPYRLFTNQNLGLYSTQHSHLCFIIIHTASKIDHTIQLGVYCIASSWILALLPQAALCCNSSTSCFENSLMRKSDILKITLYRYCSSLGPTKTPPLKRKSGIM